MRKRKESAVEISTKPKYKKLPWPGLRAKDHLTRSVTRAVKEEREKKETELWAEDQIALMLKHVSAETAMKLLLRETRRRGEPILLLATISR